VDEATEIAMTGIIQVNQLGKSYGSQRVLDGISFELHESELLVVLGESGSGKSTLLRLLAGLEPCSQGSVAIGNSDQAKIPPHQRDICMVFQSGNGYEHLTVRENLQLAAKQNRYELKNWNSWMQRWIEPFQLSDLLDKKLPQLSGGQIQRVALARAFLSGKSIAMLDEPLAHVDQQHRSQLRNLIRMTQKQTQKSMLYVTHDSSEALELADRIAVLHQGKLMQIGTPNQIYCLPNSLDVAMRLGEPSICAIALPTSLFATPDNHRAMLACGIRPRDWHSIQISRGTVRSENTLTAKAAIVEVNDGMDLELEGPIVLARWLGDYWRIEVDLGSDQLVVAVNSQNIPETLRYHLEKAGNRDPDADRQHLRIRAKVSKSQVCLFNT
jgi:ABC-type sugar transport system ATPase subunit